MKHIICNKIFLFASLSSLSFFVCSKLLSLRASNFWTQTDFQKISYKCAWTLDYFMCLSWLKKNIIKTPTSPFLLNDWTPNYAKLSNNIADRMMRWSCVWFYLGAVLIFLKYEKCWIFSSNFLKYHKWRGRGGTTNSGLVSLSADLMKSNQSSVFYHLTRSPPTRDHYYLLRMPGWFWQIEQTKFSSDSNTWEKIFMLNLLHLSFITFSQFLKLEPLYQGSVGFTVIFHLLFTS